MPRIPALFLTILALAACGPDNTVDTDTEDSLWIVDTDTLDAPDIEDDEEQGVEDVEDDEEQGVEDDEEQDDEEQDVEDVEDEESLDGMYDATAGLSLVIYDLVGDSSPDSDYCVAVSEAEILDDVLSASFDCFLVDNDNVVYIDIDGFRIDDTVEGDLSLTLNGRSHTDSFQATFDGDTVRLSFQDTWEYLPNSMSIDYSANIDLALQ